MLFAGGVEEPRKMTMMAFVSNTPVAQVSRLSSREHRLLRFSVVHKDEVVAEPLVLGKGHELGGGTSTHLNRGGGCGMAYSSSTKGAAGWVHHET